MLLAAHTAILVGIAGREYFLELLLDGNHHIGAGITGIGGEVTHDGAEQVETGVDFGTKYGCQLDELRKGCHFATDTYKHVAEVLGSETGLLVGSHHYSVNLAELVHVAHVRTTAVGAKCAEHISRGYTGTLALCGIHLHLYLGEVAGIGCHGTCHLGTLAHSFQELVGVVKEESLVATSLVLKVQLDRTGTVTGNHTRLEGKALSLGNLGHHAQVQLGISNHGTC